MSMKSLSSPRRLYPRADSFVVCFNGRYFAAPADTSIRSDLPVTCASAPSDGGRARVVVTQSLPKSEAPRVETWRSVKIVRASRS